MTQTNNKILQSSFMDINIITHNVQSKKKITENYLLISKNLDIYLLQDIGELTDQYMLYIINLQKLNTKFFSNHSETNPSRSVGLIIGPSWNVLNVYRNVNGSVIATIIYIDNFFLGIISCYLPPSLDAINKDSDSKMYQANIEEANETYDNILQWINTLPDNINWILGGDLNETYLLTDREYKSKFYRKSSTRDTFIKSFLINSNSIDLWKNLYPHSSGYTRYHTNHGAARLDYFIIPKSWYENIKNSIDLRIGNKYDIESDHRILHFILHYQLNNLHTPNIPFRIRKPKINEPIKLPNLISQIHNKWINTWNGNWTLHDILNFTNFIRLEFGKFTGWTGGNAYYKNSNFFPSKQRINLNNLQSLASIIRAINEIPNSIFYERWIQLANFYLIKLKKEKIITNDISLKNINEWIELNLSNVISNLFKNINVQDNNTQRRKVQEKYLFRDIKKRTQWLSLLGFGKNILKLPSSLLDKSETITDPTEINQIYYNQFSPLFSYKFNLTFDEKFIGISLPSIKSPRSFYSSSLPSHGSRPFWRKKFYYHNAKGLRNDIWNNLMRPVTLIELNDIISDISPNLAADIQGNHSNLIKSLFYPNSSLNNILCDIINKIFILGDIPKDWKSFYISLIPKSGAGNIVDDLVELSRPISICNEYLKIVTKILATRLNNIFLNEKILNVAQFGFLKNGSINHALTTIINILEDAKQKHTNRKNSELYLISYDLKKAYDNVQYFSIHDTLIRFGLPLNFIKLVENISFNMNGYIKTFYGLTKSFDIQKSVRQGDPLAPLLFVMFIDTLHDGLLNNPFCNHVFGYKFISNDTNIISLGFADDIVVFAENWNNIFFIHEWIRSFIWAHGGDININKTNYLISNANKKDPRWLHSCDGNQQLIPTCSNSFRYLGLHLNLKLNWKTQINKTNWMVINYCNKILASKVSTLKAIEIYKTILLPKIDIALTFAIIPNKMRNKWSRKVLHALLQCDHYPSNLISSVSESAFTATTNCILINERYWNNKMKELVYNLNSNNLDYISTINRLNLLTNSDQKINLNLYNTSFINGTRRFRHCKIIDYFNNKNIQIKNPPPINFDIINWINFIKSKIINLNEINIFTDGSTTPGDDISGIGIFIANINLKIKLSLYTYGNNYLAEVVAIAICMCAIEQSGKIKCNIFTDSKSTIDSIKFNVSNREWTRTSLMGWINLISSILFDNPNIKLIYVRSHTNIRDFESLGNNVADRLAKSANHINLIPLCFPDMKKCYIYINNQIQTSGIKNDLKKCNKIIRKFELKNLKTQGVLPLNHNIPKVHKFIYKYSVNNNEQIYSFWILSTLKWLLPNYIICKYCSFNKKLNTLHVLNCNFFKNEIIILKNNIQIQLIKLKIINYKININDISSNNSTFDLNNEISKSQLKLDVSKHIYDLLISFAETNKYNLLCGILPKSLIKLIKIYNPKTYEKDIDNFRLNMILNYYNFYKQILIKIKNNLTDDEKKLNKKKKRKKSNEVNNKMKKIKIDKNYNKHKTIKKNIKRKNIDMEHQDQMNKKRKKNIIIIGD